MEESFYRHILDRQQKAEAVPPNEVIAGWALKLLRMLYPEQSKHPYATMDTLKAAFVQFESELTHILENTKACNKSNNKTCAMEFFSALPQLYDLLNKDAEAIYNGDPAAKTLFEVIRAYPGFLAISFYRIAHQLFLQDITLLPRILTEYAHANTGIDIHPGAVIGEHFCIDHGTGIVIGETAIIGNHVKLYQGVTLGAMSVTKEMTGIKRHPTVEDHVIIYSGATILGGKTVIGQHSIIGGNVWLTESVPPHSTVYHRPVIEVVNNKIVQ